MEQDYLLIKSKKRLWLFAVLCAAACVVVSSFFATSWLEWVSDSLWSLSLAGSCLLGLFARRAERRLEQLLPEHAAEIRAYQGDPHLFRWVTMVPPEIVEPYAENYPRKEQLMLELQQVCRICRVCNIAAYAVPLTFSIAVICKLSASG